MQTRMIKRHGQEVEVPALVYENIPAIVKYGADFILEQGKRCVNKNGECSYRGQNGQCCIAGSLLDDGEIEESFTVGNLAKRKKVCIPEQKVVDILNSMQQAHDGAVDSDDAGQDGFGFEESFKKRLKDRDLSKYL